MVLVIAGNRFLYKKILNTGNVTNLVDLFQTKFYSNLITFTGLNRNTLNINEK
jgi:hypothetical protein